MPTVKSAFILAAGEGTRLRPLTETIPKPLLPVFHKPLITFALDHLMGLGIQNIGLNTRYLYEAFYRAFQVQAENPFFGFGDYEGKQLHVFREHTHLDTGGGLRNARPLLEQGTFLIHNGDILSDAPFQKLIEHHYESDALVTLLLRHEGAAKNVSFNPKAELIEGFSGAWNAAPPRSSQESISMAYTGIAIVEPAFLDWIPREGPASIIPALTKAIEANHRVAGFVAENYFWSDLGTPSSYLETHLHIAEKNWKPPYHPANKSLPAQEAIHPLATIDPSASLHGTVVVGAKTHIPHDAHLTNCILLPGAIIPPHTTLANSIVCGTSFISGKKI